MTLLLSTSGGQVAFTLEPGGVLHPGEQLITPRSVTRVAVGFCIEYAEPDRFKKQRDDRSSPETDVENCLLKSILARCVNEPFSFLTPTTASGTSATFVWKQHACGLHGDSDPFGVGFTAFNTLTSCAHC